MAEFVCQEPLQLFAGEMMSRQPCETATTASLGRWPAAKALMPRSAIQHIDRRHRQARGQGHFLNNIEKLPFGQVLSLRIDRPAAELQGDDFATAESSDILYRLPAAITRIVPPPIAANSAGSHSGVYHGT